jgi:anaerobic sulfite reductase subunit C
VTNNHAVGDKAMKWSKEAEEAVAKVPFFVRKMVRKRVEEEAGNDHAPEVSISHVHTSKRKFLLNMEDEVKGYQLESCFGADGCRNRAVTDVELSGKLELMLSAKNIRAFLKNIVKGPLKMHHEFRVSISDCPNACSRPQIVDIGLIGACEPMVSDDLCSQCGSCVEACKEGALSFQAESSSPHLDNEKCLFCGKCVDACPTGTLQPFRRGYRILVGGKLGRHPQLGRELQGLFSVDQAVEVVERCLDHHLEHNQSGERFGNILNRTGIGFLK